MNKTQRETLNKHLGVITDIKYELERMSEEEQEKYDNMPESLQNTEKAAAFLNAVDCLVEATDMLDEVISKIEELV